MIASGLVSPGTLGRGSTSSRYAVRGMVTLQQAAAVDPIEWRGLRQGESEMAVARLLAPADAFVGWLHAVFLSESGHVSAAAAAAEAALERCADAPAAEKAAPGAPCPLLPARAARAVRMAP